MENSVQIKVMDHGPYRITGNFELFDSDGNLFMTKKTVSLCRCGLSDHKPFCDGTHKGNFESQVRAEKTDAG